MIRRTFSHGHLGIALGAAGIIVLIAAAVAIGTTGTAGAITESQAIAAVQAFAPSATDLTATAALSAANGPYYTVGGSGVVANVDASDGTVRTLTMTESMPTTQVATLSTAAARAIAVSFTRAHKMDVAGLTPQTRVVSTGSANACEINFTGRANGALVPKHVSISVDPATGKVLSFVNFSHPYTSPPSPSVDGAAALAAARQLVNDPGATQDSVDLLISFDKTGRQVLVWHVALTNVAPNGNAALVEIDAVTGASVVLGWG